MLKSRRGLLAAGLALAVVGALGVASTLNAGADQITDSTQVPAADAVTSAGPVGVATPPARLPWGARPTPVRKGWAGENSKSLRAAGLTAAANDTSGSTQPRGRYAPKGRSSRTSVLTSELTDVRPPEPPDASASPSADATTDPAPGDTVTTEPTTPADPTTEATESPTDPAAGDTDPAADPTPGDPTPEPTASARSAHPEPSGAGTDPKVSYLYNLGRQEAESDGFYASVYIAKPKLGDDDYHTLGELALESADGQQIVEIGWSVDRVVNGDDDPHLFVFHWVNKVPGCYNGCGYMQSSKNIKPGDTLTYGTSKRFGIEYVNGSWWVAFDTEWVGYFPGSLWSDKGVKFSKSGLIQVFGEVAAATDHPCVTQMGTGELATKTAGAYMSSVAFVRGPTVQLEIKSTTIANGIDIYPVVPLSQEDKPPYRTFRYGGPPWTDPSTAKVKYCS